MWADRILGSRTLFFLFSPIFSWIKFYVITATASATAVINFSTTALEPQPRFLKIPQPKQEPQPRFSENSQPIHHYFYVHIHDHLHFSYWCLIFPSVASIGCMYRHSGRQTDPNAGIIYNEDVFMLSRHFNTNQNIFKIPSMNDRKRNYVCKYWITVLLSFLCWNII